MRNFLIICLSLSVLLCASVSEAKHKHPCKGGKRCPPAAESSKPART